MKNLQYIRQAQYKKGFAPVALIVILVILAGGGYILVKKSKVQSPKQETKVEQNVVSGTENQTVTDETKDWKTYKNDKYGFEFKYPIGYKTNGVDEKLDPPSLKSVWLTLVGSLTLSKDIDTNREGAEGITLRIFSNPQNLAIRDWIKTSEAIKQVGKPDTYLTLTVKNISGNEFLVFSPPACAIFCEIKAFSVSNGYTYQLVTSGGTEGSDGASTEIREDINKILSTFKFTK
ncbi:MAG: hypothetical protein Q7R65_00565 [bacterium]|nr:hypothetical protein [bacterium]